eukprot:4898896-Pyramimonas_sp.AAC.1
MMAFFEQRVVTRWVLFLSTLLVLFFGEDVLAAEHHRPKEEEERLIGWRGETHHTNVCWGKRNQCYGVNVNTGRKAN